MLERKYLYPWRNGNRCELLDGGSRFFPAMLEAIADARRYILLEQYLVESGAISELFVDALAAAANRGVQVYVLLDDFGAIGFDRSERHRLEHAGVHLARFNPLAYRSWRSNLFRDHRKLLLIDGTTAFTGGAGIDDHFSPEHSRRAWHDVVIRIEGPSAGDWHDLFRESWEKWRPEVKLPLPPEPPVHDDGWPGRLVVASAPQRIEIKRSLLTRVQRARRRVCIATAYLIPSMKLRRQLRRAAERGIEVRLLVPGPDTDHPAVRHASRRYYSRLLRHGVHIHEYQPRFLHAKLLLVDDWISIGSANMDRWNMRWNLEANQEIASLEVAEVAAEWFERHLALSREIDWEHWRRRSIWSRVWERFWGQIDLAMSRFGQSRGRD